VGPPPGTRIERPVMGQQFDRQGGQGYQQPQQQPRYIQPTKTIITQDSKPVSMAWKPREPEGQYGQGQQLQGQYGQSQGQYVQPQPQGQYVQPQGQYGQPQGQYGAPQGQLRVGASNFNDQRQPPAQNYNQQGATYQGTQPSYNNTGNLPTATFSTYPPKDPRNPPTTNPKSFC
jgi:hypothetical protein